MPLVAAATLGLGAPDALAAPGDFVAAREATSANAAVTVPTIDAYAIDWDCPCERNLGSDAPMRCCRQPQAPVLGGLESMSIAASHANAAKLQYVGQWEDAGWNAMDGAF